MTDERIGQFLNTMFDLVVIASSAGGLKALSQVLSGLEEDFPAAVVIVQHVQSERESLMAGILANRTQLHVKSAEAGDRLEPGSVLIAPPDFHTILDSSGRIVLQDSAPIKFSRPAADPLFESAAALFGPRTIAVVLTGRGHDGSRGAVAIHNGGGFVIAQDENSSAYFSMPESAIDTGVVNLVLPVEKIAGALKNLVLTGASS